LFNYYLVVWSGDDTSLADDENEIFGQAINAATGAPLVGNIQLSDMGPSLNADYDATNPAVAYDSDDEEFVVVWQGDDDTGSLVDNEFEIFGQRLEAPITLIGGNLRLSDMGPNGDPNYDAFEPAAAYDSAANEYLVVWRGDDDTGTLVDNELEIFGQRVSAANGYELGANDFRISDMGPDGSTVYGALEPAAAYSSAANEYLVAWRGSDDGPGLALGEYEIFGQRFAGATSSQVGTNDFRLSDMGPDGDAAFAAFSPALAHNAAGGEYLVVWEGEDDAGGLVDDEFEIFGQRLNAATGAEAGGDTRLSAMGADKLYFGLTPDVAYNSLNHEYLVVWDGDDNTNPLVDNELEIFGQRVDAATGLELGPDFRISHMGPDGSTSFTAFSPAVAYNSAANEYLVVWWGDDLTATLVDNEFEIFGQRLAGATGLPLGGRFRISDMGPDGDYHYGAQSPAVAYGSLASQYLVVWLGDDNSQGLVENELEIFSQRLDAAGGELGGDTRLSHMGPDGSPVLGAFSPDVAYNRFNHQYLVVWHGDDTSGGLVDEEREIFGQRVAGTTGFPVGTNFRISNMGPDGDPDYDAFNPAVAYNHPNNQYLVVWEGDDDGGGLVDDEFEIFGQRLAGGDGAEVAGDFRLSDMGPDGNTLYVGEAPDVANNSLGNEYLVVWRGRDDSGGLAINEGEIFGQRVQAATGAELGGGFRLSDMGPDGSPLYTAESPALAFAGSGPHSEYLVAWWGDDDSLGLVEGEYEIFGQRLRTLYDLLLPVVAK
jgi:hypothetical protein